MKKRLLIAIVFLTFIFCFNFLYSEPYPAPKNLTASVGIVDTIKISWDIPIPPAFGEGFESGEMPPSGWNSIVNNEDHSWQIMNNVDYVHSGSYSACVPWTDTPGVLIGYGEEKILNGDFTAWNEDLPTSWDVQTSIHIDSLNMTQDILAFTSTSTTKYVSQTFNTSKYTHYQLTFKSKQNNIDNESSYFFKIYAGNSKLIEEKLYNSDWQDYEYDVYSSSNAELQIRLYPSNESDSTLVYWDDVSIKEFIYEPNQDEWLISPEYQANPDDILTFYLGTSKMYGINAPIYGLLSIDNGQSWQDTLVVCDGMDNNHETWGDEDGKLKEYSVSLQDYLTQEETITIAFRYLGGNGDLVCVDDVGIGNNKLDLIDWYVIQRDEKITTLSSRAKKVRSNKESVLTGFELYRKIYREEVKFDSIGYIEPTINHYSDVHVDSLSIKENVAYIYKIKAIYNNSIYSSFSNSDVGCLFDDVLPKEPREPSIETRWKAEDNFPGIRLSWKNPYIYADIDSFYIYDNDSLIIKTELTVDPGTYSQFLYQDSPQGQALTLNNKKVSITITSVDFNGNESIIDDNFEVYPPPYFDSSKMINNQRLYYQIEFENTKWDDITSPFNLSDTIKIYRSSSEDLDSFSIYKVLDDSSYYTNSGCFFLDTDVDPTKEYDYCSTMMYNDNGVMVESEKSAIRSITSNSKMQEYSSHPTLIPVNISDLSHTLSTDSIVTFTWAEPITTDSLTYGGVYIYKGPSTTAAIDTVYKDNTSYTYIFNNPTVNRFTIVPFDAFGFERSTVNGNTLIDENNKIYNVFGKMDYVHICLDTNKVIETFEDGLDPLWSQLNLGDSECEWYASDDGSSQWFSITDYDGNYAWINDDLFGQFAQTDCYLSLPPIVGLSSSDKVVLCFEAFLSEQYDGSAYISINPNGDSQDILNMFLNEQYRKDFWRRYSLNLTPYLTSTIDSFQIAFHYNDNGTWSQGWAIDNVYVISTSIPQNPIATKLNVENSEFYFSKTFPNPFRNKLNFSFILTEPSKVSFDIYNIKGQKVRSINDVYSQGINNIVVNSKDNNGNKLPSGIYLYKITINDDVRFDKIIHLE